MKILNVISEALIIAMFTSMITSGFFMLLLFDSDSYFYNILASLFIWGFCAVLFKVNATCDIYLKISRLKAADLTEGK